MVIVLGGRGEMYVNLEYIHILAPPPPLLLLLLFLSQQEYHNNNYTDIIIRYKSSTTVVTNFSTKQLKIFYDHILIIHTSIFISLLFSFFSVQNQ